MSRYRKTMRQAIEEGLSNMQVAVLKKEYEPMRGKTITAGRAKQLMNILDKFKEADLKKLSQANIPFVSSGANSKMIIRKMKFKVTTINPFKEEVIQEDFDLEEGKMKTIATMFDQGKSAEEIAKAMKLPVKTIKSILGEEEIHEFKKMTVTFKSMDDMSKASTDLAKQGFTIRAIGKMMKVDGKGADLNKYATDLKNFYKADVRAESYAIDESADEDKYNPITEACWVGYKKVGMKKKGDKMVPNCVPESVQEEKEEESKEEAPKKEKSEDKEKLKADIEKKDAEIQSLKVKAETEKAKTAKKETEKMVNPETGEPLLQVGVAYKHMRDKMKKEKEMQKEDSDYLKSKMNSTQIANIKKVWQHKTKKDVTPAVIKMIKDMDIPTQLAIKHAKINQLSGLVEMANDKAYAIGMATAKKKYNDEPPLDKKTIKKAHEIGDKLSKMKNEDHPAKQMFEQIEGLKNKAEKSGMPYGILKKVYDRGMAAWRGGHRPGTTQQQWAFARVNSFITKSSGTWGGADKDLAAKVKGKSESLEEASLYAFKEYEPSQSYEATRDMKNVEDAIKRAGGKIKSKEKPTRREPNASFEIETSNPNAVKAAIKKADPEFNID